MKIENIKLENIRSFVNNSISIPNGSVLLSGDIGSGKSSILLAIEFALFGLLRGELSGGELLRSGTNSGSVTLNFNVDNKNVEIKRTLKGGTSVTQDSGYIIIDDKKEELTPNELKQRVLEILNYPKELLTKSKSLIYRYTVYTPQEEMKRILVESKEIRLDTLRKVFGIDKYKRITDNTKILTIYLRETKKELEGKTEDLDKLKEQYTELKRKEKEVNQFKESSDILVNSAKVKLDAKRKQMLDAEKSRKYKTDLEILDGDLKNKIARQQDCDKSIERLKVNVVELEQEITRKEDYTKNLEDIKKTIYEIQNKLSEIDKKKSYLEAKKESSIETKDQINELDLCPLCKQKVGKDHKHFILKTEDTYISEYEKKTKALENLKEQLTSRLESENKELEEFLNKQKEYEIAQVKIESLKEKKERHVELIDIVNKIKQEVVELNMQKQELNNQFNEIKELDYNKVREDYEILSDELKNLEVEKAGIETNLKNIQDNLTKLNNQIGEKQKLKVDINRITELINWINKSFLNLMEIVERKIMLKVYHDFNNLFQKWFSILVDTENLDIKLDEEFSPKIVQNGYDINFNYLSGGEKTAAALAYRLALNQVINNIMVNIKTNDFIILDEPTDGFSEQQLERMRLVLDELDISQVILVSHEAKIESFVDNVIKLKKENHVSNIV